MKIFAAIRSFVRKIFNFHEAGQRWSTSRSRIPGPWSPQDSRYDDPPAERNEVMRKARYFERNNAIANRLADLFEQYTVGPTGMPIMAASSDEKWNAANQKSWDGWCKFPDLVSLQNFATIQSLVARRWFFDGEIFILKTRSDVTKRPRIQLIESHRVSTPPELYAQEGSKIIDGIEVDTRGRPVAYWVQEGETWSRKDAKNIIHVFEPTRPGQMRAFSFLDPVLNDLHDLDDLQILEMLAAKDAAEKSAVVTTKDGEIADLEDTIRNAGQVTTQDSQGEDSLETRIKHYRQVIGGRMIALKEGESMQQFISQRPSVALQWYWDYLAGKICIGVGIPKILVFPQSMQGTVVRGDYDVANGFFRSRSSVLQNAFSQIYLYVTEEESLTNRALADKPFDWQEHAIQAPRAVNVDVGYNSSATIKELESGITDYEEVFAESGHNWKARLRKKAIQARYIRDLAKEFDVEVCEISTLQQDRSEHINADEIAAAAAAKAQAATQTANE